MLPRDNQHTRERTTNATEIIKQSSAVNTCLEQFAMDQFDPWQVVPRQVFTLYSRLLISIMFVGVSHVGCLGITGVFQGKQLCHFSFYSSKLNDERQAVEWLQAISLQCKLLAHITVWPARTGRLLQAFSVNPAVHTLFLSGKEKAMKGEV